MLRRVFHTALICLGTLAGLPMTAAAATSGKDHPSSDLPWVIGVVVLIALLIVTGLAVLWVRRPVGPGRTKFRSQDSATH